MSDISDIIEPGTSWLAARLPRRLSTPVEWLLTVCKQASILATVSGVVYVAFQSMFTQFTKPSWVTHPESDEFFRHYPGVVAFINRYWTSEITLFFACIIVIFVTVIAGAQRKADQKASKLQTELADQRMLFQELTQYLSSHNTESRVGLHRSFRWLTSKYRNAASIDALREYCELFKATCTQVATDDIAKDFVAQARTATDYLCVIAVGSNNQLLVDIRSSFEYFRLFDRKACPRDRLTRVFSITVSDIKRGGAHQINSFKHNLDQEAAKALLAALFINKICGVDTKLHIFKKGTSPVIFEGADYVLCSDPAAEPNAIKRTLYVAIPRDERKCLKITDAPVLHSVFEYEFYHRLTEAAKRQEFDSEVFDFTRANCPQLAALLGISTGQVEELKAALLKLASDLIDGADKQRWTSAVNGWPWT